MYRLAQKAFNSKLSSSSKIEVLTEYLSNEHRKRRWKESAKAPKNFLRYEDRIYIQLPQSTEESELRTYEVQPRP